MKNLSLVLILICSSITLLAQNVTSDILVKKWIIKAIEEFGEEYQIDGVGESEHTKDWLTFAKNGTFSGLFENKHVEGTWAIKSGKVYITANKAKSIKKINWIKVATSTKELLSFTYQSENLIRTTLIFIPVNTND